MNKDEEELTIAKIAARVLSIDAIDAIAIQKEDRPYSQYNTPCYTIRAYFNGNSNAINYRIPKRELNEENIDWPSYVKDIFDKEIAKQKTKENKWSVGDTVQNIHDKSIAVIEYEQKVFIKGVETTMYYLGGFYDDQLTEEQLNTHWIRIYSKGDKND